jgi:hypothetical protein
MPQRPQHQGRQHIRINSQEVSVPINFCTTSRENNRISLDIFKPHEVTLPTRIKSIGGSYKRVWPNYRRLHVLKFSGQHARAETKQS